MLPRKIVENLHPVMAILAKLGLNFLTLILSASPNKINFVRTFLIMRA